MSDEQRPEIEPGSDKSWKRNGVITCPFCGAKLTKMWFEDREDVMRPHLQRCPA